MAKPATSKKGARRRRSVASVRAARPSTSSSRKGARLRPGRGAKRAGEERGWRRSPRAQATARRVPAKAETRRAPVVRPRISGAAKMAPAPGPVVSKVGKGAQPKGAAATGPVKPEITPQARVEEIKSLIVLGKKKGYLTYDEIMAHLPEDEIQAVIGAGVARLTGRTIVDPARLRRSLAEIRRRGYAVTSDERVEGASAVSAPVRDGTGRVVAGLTISGPTYRFTPDRVRRFTALVLEGASKISAALGHEQARTRRAGAR